MTEGNAPNRLTEQIEPCYNGLDFYARKREVILKMGRERPQETVVRETKRIAAGVACMLAVMFAVYACMGRMKPGVVIGGLAGGAYAVFNFFMLGMTVQKAAKETDETMARMRLRSSYSMRMVGAVLLGVIAFALPFVDGLSFVIPLLFPRATILLLQITGQIKD